MAFAGLSHSLERRIDKVPFIQIANPLGFALRKAFGTLNHDGVPVSFLPSLQVR